MLFCRREALEATALPLVLQMQDEAVRKQEGHDDKGSRYDGEDSVAEEDALRDTVTKVRGDGGAHDNVEASQFLAPADGSTRKVVAATGHHDVPSRKDGDVVDSFPRTLYLLEHRKVLAEEGGDTTLGGDEALVGSEGRH